MANSDPFSDGMVFFGSEVKRIRERTGMTQQELADAMHYSLDTVKSVEIGREFGSIKLAQAADKVFAVGEGLERLREFIDGITMRPWFRDKMIMERKAADILEYEPYVVSGLLQTERYMRAVAGAERPAPSPAEVDQRVALRLERQQVIVRKDDPPNLWVIMEESALMREVGGAETMADQCAHLLCMAERPNVTIQVVQHKQGVTAGIGRAFSVLTIKPSNSSLVYLEEIDDARYIRDAVKVRRYMRAFDHLRASAADEAMSVQIIKGAYQ